MPKRNLVIGVTFRPVENMMAHLAKCKNGYMPFDKLADDFLYYDWPKRMLTEHILDYYLNAIEKQYYEEFVLAIRRLVKYSSLGQHALVKLFS